MIKRILVALDPDSDTPVAIHYAADIARRYGAEVTGLAVVDLENISADTRGGGIGSMYYAERLRENLTEETRAKARALTQAFEEALQGTGIEHSNTVAEGVPFQRIVEDMKYYDLLVIGRTPHFFYHDPSKRTETLARVVQETVAPAFVVGTEYEPVDRVLIAYDGSTASARALQSFVNLMPFGSDHEVELLSVWDEDESDAELMLRLAQSYLKAHGFDARTTSLSGSNPARQIAEYARTSNADVVVAGARVVSKLRRFAFGSTTASLLESCPRPLFVQH